MRIKSSIEGRSDHYLTDEEVKDIARFACMLADSFECEVNQVQDRLLRCLWSVQKAKEAVNSIDVRTHVEKAIAHLYA